MGSRTGSARLRHHTVAQHKGHWMAWMDQARVEHQMRQTWGLFETRPSEFSLDIVGVVVRVGCIMHKFSDFLNGIVGIRLVVSDSCYAGSAGNLA